MDEFHETACPRMASSSAVSRPAEGYRHSHSWALCLAITLLRRSFAKAAWRQHQIPQFVKVVAAVTLGLQVLTLAQGVPGGSLQRHCSSCSLKSYPGPNVVKKTFSSLLLIHALVLTLFCLCPSTQLQLQLQQIFVFFHRWETAKFLFCKQIRNDFVILGYQ